MTTDPNRDAFTEGHLAVLATLAISETEDGTIGHDGLDPWDIPGPVAAEAAKDAHDFYDENRDVIDRTIAEFATGDVAEFARQLGADFALTRNRHGAGFWDRGFGRLGDELTELAHPYGELVIVVDDEGTITLVA